MIFVGTANSHVRVQVQKAIRYHEWPVMLHDAMVEKGPVFQTHEVVAVQDHLLLLREDQLLSRESNVILDYDFENIPGARVHQDRVNLEALTLSRVWNRKRNLVMSLRETSPLRGELEIATYGRQYLVDTLHSQRCVSLPYQLYSDGLACIGTCIDL